MSLFFVELSVVCFSCCNFFQVPHVIALNVLVLNFSFSWIMLHDFSVLFMSILGV